MCMRPELQAKEVIRELNEKYWIMFFVPYIQTCAVAFIRKNWFGSFSSLHFQVTSSLF